MINLICLNFIGVSVHVSNASPKSESLRGRHSPGTSSLLHHVTGPMSYGVSRTGMTDHRALYKKGGNAMSYNGM